MKFKNEFVTEAKDRIVITVGDKFVTAKGSKVSLTDNLELAYTFDSEAEAIDFEDKYADDIDGFSYLKKVVKGKIVDV